MAEQKRMSIEMLAEYLPEEAQWVANNGVGGSVACVRELVIMNGRWESSYQTWHLPFEIDYDGPWEDSLIEIRPKKRWRAEEGKKYFFATTTLRVAESSDLVEGAALLHFNAGNYWQTEEQAQHFADETVKLAMRLHEEDEDHG